MKKIIIASLLLAGYLTGFAQSELPKFAPNPDKVKVVLDMPLEGRKYKNGTGHSLNPKLLSEMPKKVALVSFYSFDPGMTKVVRWKTQSSGYYYNTITTHTKTTKRSAKGGSGQLAVGYFLQSIDALKEGFSEFGMELLLPEEYLDTEAKATYYENFVVERAKFNEWVSNMGSGGHDIIYGYPEGFNVLDVVNEPYGN